MTIIKNFIYRSYLYLFPYRIHTPFIDYLKTNNHKNSIGCEIGVASGFNARLMFESVDIKKLYLVDPYIIYIDTDEIVKRYADSFPIAKKRLLRYWDKIVFLKKNFIDAIEEVPDNLDFIYFDATGNKDMVSSFLNNWFSKVKTGGFIAGRRFDANYLDNCRVVLAFTKKHSLKLGGSGSYWFIKK